jgi:hypothetical protein
MSMLRIGPDKRASRHDRSAFHLPMIDEVTHPQFSNRNTWKNIPAKPAKYIHSIRYTKNRDEKKTPPQWWRFLFVSRHGTGRLTAPLTPSTRHIYE